MTGLAPLPDTALRLFDDFTTPLDRTVWTPKVDKKPGRSGVQFRDDLTTVTTLNSCLELSVRETATPGVYSGGEVTTLGNPRVHLRPGRSESPTAGVPGACAAPSRDAHVHGGLAAWVDHVGGRRSGDRRGSSSSPKRWGVGRNAPTGGTPLPATTRIDWVKVWH